MNSIAFRLIVAVLFACSLLGANIPALAESLTLQPALYLPMVQKDGVSSRTVDLDVAFRSSCMVTAGKYVQCWGESFAYLEGDVLFPSINHAVTIPGLTGVESIAVGYDFACALTNAGGVKCWGQNGSGQLGNNSLIDSVTPVDVAGLNSGVIAITAGDLFACALNSGRAMFCWGNGAWGQMGIENEDNQIAPVAVTGMDGGVTSMAAGNSHVCAVKNGGLWCWGSNEFGQVGAEQVVQNEFRLPMPVHGLSAGVASAAAGGQTTCAVMNRGVLKCWGRNRNGQVGNGTFGTDESWPADVSGLFGGVKSVALGDYTTCATMLDGTARCWGRGDSGQIGNGQADFVNASPQQVNGISGAVEVNPAQSHTCARLVSGTVQCWGENLYGQLGDGTNNDSLTPVTVIE